MFIILIPSPLIEFRYYTIPLLLLHFEIKPFLPEQKNEKEIAIKSKFTIFDSQLLRSLNINILFFLAIDIALLSVFAFKPFKCPFGPNCRFMF